MLPHTYCERFNRIPSRARPSTCHPGQKAISTSTTPPHCKAVQCHATQRGYLFCDQYLIRLLYPRKHGECFGPRRPDALWQERDASPYWYQQTVARLSWPTGSAQCSLQAKKNDWMARVMVGCKFFIFLFFFIFFFALTLSIQRLRAMCIADACSL